MSDITPRNKLAAARILVRKKAPYFSHGLSSLIPWEAPGLGTFAVTEKLVLMYDPEIVMRWSIKHIAAVLVHELSHVLRNHAGRARRMKIGPTQFMLWNIAADAEINDDLEDGGWSLPDDPVLPRKIEMRTGLTAEEYFRSLLKGAEEESKQQSQQGSGQGQGQGQGGGGGGQQSQGQGGGGGGGEQSEDVDYSDGGANDPAPKESQLEPSSRNGKGKMQYPRCGSGAGYAAPGEPQDIVPGRSDTEVERVRNTVAESMRKEAQRSRGSVPGGWARWADARLTKPEVPWQQKLGVLARRAVTYKAGVVDYKYDRPSRRQGAFGFGDGKILLPRMRAPVPNVTIAIDTSGSMGTDEMTAALRETKGILNATGSKIEVIAADTRVTDVKQVHRVEDVRKLLKGGGGTDFRPVFEMLDRRSTGRPDVLIYMTDGYGPAPQSPPAGMTVIWLLMGRWGFKKPCTWGEALEVKAAA